MINSLRTPLGASAIVFSSALLIGIGIFSFAVSKLRPNEHIISVTGSTTREVKSDTAKIRLSVSKRATLDNYGWVNKVLTENVEAVKNQIKKSEITEENITVEAPRTMDICAISQNGYSDCSLGVTGYDITIDIIVETDKVELAKKLAGTISANMSAQKINVRVSQVEYYFNGLADLRVSLLNEATINAKARAEEIAKSTGSKLGNLTSASTGVFQVTQKNSTEVSDYGIYDTSTVDKKVTAVVRTSFILK